MVAINHLNTDEVVFSIDVVDSEGVHGWAHTNNNMGVELIVEFENKKSVSIQANHFREDLKVNNKVDGCCAFFIPIGMFLSISEQEVVRVLAVCTDIQEALFEVTLESKECNPLVGIESKLSGNTLDIHNPNLVGHIDHISREVISGWIADIGSDDSYIELDIYINGAIKATITANKKRDDLLLAGINQGKHGFECYLSEICNNEDLNKAIEVLIKPCGFDFILMDSPKVLEAEEINSAIPKTNNVINKYKFLNLNEQMKKDILTIQESGLFDKEYYTKRYVDVVKENLNPIEHYVRTESREKRNPNSLFDTKFYKKHYLKNSKENALVHYINFGAKKGNKTSKDFNSEVYLSLNPDVKIANQNPLYHYIKFGLSEGREITLPKNVKDHCSPSVLSMDSFFADKPTCSIIIPVYNAVEETKACIDSVLRYTDLNKHNIIVMNDCSPDERVKPMLDSYIGKSSLLIVHNDENLGYTVNVNKGLKLAKNTDVLLLNSDTIVTPKWMRNIQIAAYSSRDIGTVTAVSNNAGAFSVPLVGTNVIPEDMVINDMAAIVSKNHELEYMDVPTGNGFCFYIKKALLNEIGDFDEEAFPRGYGEENDFCMRAIRKGWRNIIDFKTYVYHVRTASFKEEKVTLIKNSLEIVKERYPDYSALTRSIGISPIMVNVRNKIKNLLETVKDSKDNCAKPVVMYVLSTMTGGTPQTNKDLMKGVSSDFDTFVLACNKNKIDVLELKNEEYVILETYKLKEPILFSAHGSSEYRQIAASILFKYNVDLLHIRHIAWHDLTLPRIAKKLDIKVIYSLHDFYAACPSVNLIDNSAVYHPLGAIKDAANPLWNDVTCLPMNKALLNLWKSRMSQSLSYADLFITTNQSGKDILQNNLDILNERNEDFFVIPHGRDFDGFERLETREEITKEQKINILLPGNIGHSKGARLIKEIKEKDLDNKYIFHVLGRCTKELDGYVINHGEYKRSEFASKVRKINPDITAVLSIWPETYCHTLTESWAMGLPVLAVNLGAVGDRITRRGGGWLCSSCSDELIKTLDSIIQNPNQIDYMKDKIHDWQSEYGKLNNIKNMADKYSIKYMELLEVERSR